MGNNLRIDSIGIHDGGKYSCEAEVEATEPLAVVHIVEILGEVEIELRMSSLKVEICLGLTTRWYWLQCRILNIDLDFKGSYKIINPVNPINKSNYLPINYIR